MPSRSMLVALLALFVALGGPAEARKLIDGKTIRKNTVSSKQIKNRSLTTTDLSRGTTRSLRATPARSVGASQLLDGAVTLAKLAPSSVTGAQVADRSLSAVDLVADTLTAGELAPNAVGNGELANNAVSNAKLRTGAVTKGKIGASDVGSEELIDGDARLADLGAFSGKVTGDFPAIAPATCQFGDFPVTPTRAGGTLAGSVVVIGAPTALPDGLLISGRPKDATTLRVQVCNLTAASADPGPLDFPYLAIAP